MSLRVERGPPRVETDTARQFEPGAAAEPGAVADVLGRSTRAAHLTEQVERAVLRARGGHPVLIPYGECDPRRPPVVLVHGINGSAEDLRRIADDLTAAGKQVHVFFYDDVGERTSTNGRLLAGELQRLRQEWYAPGTRLQIVAHSMGGIVSRLALNELERSGAPRGGFGDVRFAAIDTPWAGYPHEPRFMRGLMEPILNFVLGLLGRSGFADMRASSRMFDDLYSQRLEGVRIETIAARQPRGEGDHAMSVDDLSNVDLVHAVRITQGDPNGFSRLRNLAGGLAQDERWPAVLAEIRQQGLSLQSEESAPAIRAIIDRHMPAVDGTHAGVLYDPSLIGRLRYVAPGAPPR